MVEESLSFYLYMASNHGETCSPSSISATPMNWRKATRECREILEAIYNCFVGIFESAISTGQQDGSIASDVAAKQIRPDCFFHG